MATAPDSDLLTVSRAEIDSFWRDGAICLRQVFDLH